MGLQDIPTEYTGLEYAIFSLSLRYTFLKVNLVRFKVLQIFSAGFFFHMHVWIPHMSAC